MMNRFLSIAIIGIATFTFFSCKETNNNPLPDHIKCLVTSFTITSQDGDLEETISISFSYDAIWRLHKSTYVNRIAEYIYNSDGNLSRVMFYYNGENIQYNEYTWEGNQISIFSYRKLSGNFQMDNWKTVLLLNDIREIPQVENYFMENEIWVMHSYFVNTWQNGNVTMQEFYEPQTDNRERERTISSKSWFSPYTKDLMSKYVQEDDVAFLYPSKSFVKYRTSTYTYDSMNNPFSKIDALYFEYANDPMLLSKNNIESHVKTYHYGGEDNSSNYSFSYQYSGNEFPTEINLLRQSWNGDQWIQAEKWNLKYLCN